jgi:hypothetical protein
MRGHLIIEMGRGSNIGLWSIRSWLAGDIHKSIEGGDEGWAES